MKFKKLIALICTFASMLPNLLNVYADSTTHDIDEAQQFLTSRGYVT